MQARVHLVPSHRGPWDGYSLSRSASASSHIKAHASPGTRLAMLAIADLKGNVVTYKVQ